MSLRMNLYGDHLCDRPAPANVDDGTTFRLNSTDELFAVCVDPETGLREWKLLGGTKKRLDLAMAALERLANEQNVLEWVTSAWGLGSSGAGHAYADVQKFAQKTLDEIKAVTE